MFYIAFTLQLLYLSENGIGLIIELDCCQIMTREMNSRLVTRKESKSET